MRSKGAVFIGASAQWIFKITTYLLSSANVPSDPKQVEPRRVSVEGVSEAKSAKPSASQPKRLQQPRMGQVKYPSLDLSIGGLRILAAAHFPCEACGVDFSARLASRV